MSKSNFRIVPLATAVAEAARETARRGASDHAIVEVDSPTGYPCRHCLQWVQPGERVILFPFASIEPGHPYAESGPIFVHEKDCPQAEANAQFPAAFRESRVLRAYDCAQNMIDAVALNGHAPEEVIARLFENPAAAFLQARSATRGCFTFKIERA